MKKEQLAWVLRVTIAALFLISALAKIAKGWIPEFPFIDFSPNFAISTFEVKQLYPLGFSEGLASYFSRTLIGIEFALGFLLLNNNYLKKITIPSTIGLLVIFILHLSYETWVSGNVGNCGCFGELLPMTPVEAIIKNIIAIGLLIGLWKIQTPDSKSNIWILTTITIACVLGLFMLAPMKASTSINTMPAFDKKNDSLTNIVNEINLDTLPEVKVDSTKNKKTANVDNKKIAEPKPTKSSYTEFYSDIDKGKKIFCFFVPGCEHCRETAKELNAMRKKYKDFPEVRIVFMNEEAEKIPDFFQFVGHQFPYKVIDVIPFWTKLGSGRDTPGVIYLWNGNVIKFYDGIAEKAFNKKAFEKLINQPYTDK
ncbi:TlpA family protein disulfide reductase [Flavobacterium sp.]|jgi:hypothetical protein|uniref:TlpA family protein disulfide reductase n=1 Tax=Flavobacterium sp. TaxID=239 RepID=UPI0037BF4E10